MNRTIILMLALTAVLGAATLAAAVKVTPPSEKVIPVKAKKFAFTPNEITVKKGEPLALELTSEDRPHGFYLPDFGIRSEIKPGTIIRVRLTPEKTGKFGFACDVFCGSGHEEMSGTLIVTD